MDSQTNLFENDNYVVKTHSGQYAVINKVTGIIEVETKMLPDAYMAAAGLNDALIKKPWSWYEKGDVAAGMDAFLFDGKGTGPTN